MAESPKLQPRRLTGVEEHDGDVKFLLTILTVTFNCGLGYGADTTFHRTYF